MASKKIEDALDAFVRSKQKGTYSGNYQRNARRVIQEWSILIDPSRVET